MKDVLTGVMVAEIYARKMQLSIRVSIRSISNVVAVVVSKLLLLENERHPDFGIYADYRMSP